MSAAGIEIVVAPRDARIGAVHREDERQKIVGADGNEIGVAHELRQHEGQRRHFQHGADQNLARPVHAEQARALDLAVDQRAGAVELVDVR